MNCPFCASHLPLGSTFCPACGANLSANVQPGLPGMPAIPAPPGAVIAPPTLQPIDPYADMYRDKVRSRAKLDIGLGIGLLALGLLVTVGTYSSASSSGGGTYFIAYGPMIVGVIRLIKGLAKLGG